MSVPSPSRENEAELQSLVNAAVEGAASVGELKQLGRLLEEHPHLVPRYLDHFVIDTHLSWDGLGISLPHRATGQRQAALKERGAPQGSRAKRWGSALAIAASLMLFACLFNADAPAVSDTDAIAHVVSLTPQASATLKDGDPLGAGVFQLSDGETATLEFRSGSQLYCEGPCRIDLVSAMLVTLEHGKVTADVPPAAIGFTVLTKRLEVIDLGTRFGVDVDANEDVDVVVFDGKVNLSDPEGRVELPKGLFAGEALSVGQSDRFERLMSIGQDFSSQAWASSWQTDTNLRRSVFSSVTDNLAPDSEPNFYGVISRGLVEDAPAYSDRVHEWNSLPNHPLPAWLRGADLIRRFNSRKYDHSSLLEVTVTFSADCVLYVLWDTRCEPLPWLKERFKNTDYLLGMDEGPYIGDVYSVDVGPGKSIDTTYAVWAARVSADEEIKLGILGSEHLGQYKNLYGIAAKPLDRIAPEFFPRLINSTEE